MSGARWINLRLKRLNAMGVPKRKMSKMRLRTRKASLRWHAPKLNKCAQCGSTVVSHRACPSCGYYKRRQVLTIEA